MKNKVVLSILAIFLGTLILVGSFVFLNYNSDKNVIVTVKTVSESFETTGYLVKNETVIDLSGGAFVRFYVDEGERISARSNIASVYDSESDGNILSEIYTIDEKIKSLRDEYVSLTRNDVVKIETYIDSDIDSLQSQNYNGNLSESLLIGGRLNTLFNIKHSGKAGGDDEEKALMKERAALEARLSSAKYDIKADDSGIFVGKTDGYEGIVDFSRAKEISVSEFDALTNQKQEENTKQCKIVDNYSWLIMCKVPSDYMVKANVGKKVKMITDSGEDISGRIEYISVPEDGECVLTLSSDRDFSGIGRERFVELKIVFSEYSGYVIPSKAFHLYENKYGVFVERGNSLVFKETEVIYSDEEYAVVNPGGRTEVKLYDNVLIEGDLSEFYY